LVGNKIKFYSVKQERATPDSLFNKLNEELNFEWDLAVDENNKKCFS